MTAVNQHLEAQVAAIEQRAARFTPYEEYRSVPDTWVRKVPTHWDLVATKRLFRIESGSTPKSDVREYWDGDIIWLTPEDLTLSSSRDVTDSRRRITQQGYASCGTKLVPSGSLVLSTRAPIGYVGIARTQLCTNQGCRCLVPQSSLDSTFYFYLFMAAHSVLQSLGQGSTFVELGRDDLGQFRVTVPPIEEQEAIASFLDRETAKIDALIAKKEQLIALLEEKRSALISHVVTKGLEEGVEIKDLGVEWFGQIPAAWEVRLLRRVVSQFVDYRGRTPEKVRSGIPLVTARNIKNGRIDFSESEEFISDGLYDEWMVRGLPEPGDVLLTTEAPLGACALVEAPNIGLAQRIILLKVDKTIVASRFLYRFVSSLAGHMELHTRATGSTALGIKASHLRNVRLPIPPLSEQEKMVEFLDVETRTLIELQHAVTNGIQLLWEYRSALISAAVTGQIDVRGVAA